jgi:anti-sigma-K factor RskA
MSEDRVSRQDGACEAYAGDLAELALGVLTGRERARALSHVESCARCSDELEQLSRVADTVVQAAPDVEPPVGFEVRLFERMGVHEPRHRHWHRPRGPHRLRPAYWVPAVGAAAAVAVALGLGLGLSSSPAPTTSAQGQAQAQQRILSAALVSDGATVGHVVTFGGDKPWMSMMLDDSAAHGTVNCVVVTQDGVTHHVGTFVVHKDYAAWASRLPVNPADVRTAEVVSPSGTVLATASLS